jgi:acyl-CoA thioester hydrolase
VVTNRPDASRDIVTDPVATREVTSRVRVRYAETDQAGIVYYANYFVWFEVGRCEWLRCSGMTYRAVEESGILFPVIEACCEYRQPAHYDDDLEIRTRGRLLSPVRVQFDYEVVERESRTTSAVGRTVHVSTDRAGRPRRLPAPIRSLFQ